jgi:hypothetical protein
MTNTRRLQVFLLAGTLLDTFSRDPDGLDVMLLDPALGRALDY